MAWPARIAFVSGMCSEKRFVGQAGGELFDIEGPIKASVKLLAIREEADLVGLSRKQASDPRVKPTHQRTFPSSAPRSAVADVAHFVGEDLAVEPFDACGHVWFVGEYLDTDAAQLVEHDAARHFRRSHECES